MKTQAIVFREANKPTLEELELPELKEGEMRVRAHFTGVSIGTESSIFSGTRTQNGTFPLVGGYMASGEIEELGPGVSNFAVGDRIVWMASRLEGEVNSVWGGHCSIQTASAARATPIPEGVDMKEAAMFVMPGVGLNAISMANVVHTDRVLILGQGLIGQFFGQWCRNRGAVVIVAEPDATRRELARKYVTDHVLDPGKDGWENAVTDIVGRQGPSVVVEATGSPRLIGQATPFIARGGKMVFLSWYPGEITLDFAHFHNYQATAFFPTSAGGPEAARATLAGLARGAITMGENLSHVVPAEEACDGYRRIIDGDRSIMGMVIDWR